MVGFNAEEFERFVRDDDGQAIVMLNLLRFRPNGGREQYFEYLKAAGPFVGKYGGEILYAGDGLPILVGTQAQSWDAIALVRYPSRRAFADMVADPGYQATSHLRADSLTEAVLQPTRRVG